MPTFTGKVFHLDQILTSFAQLWNQLYQFPNFFCSIFSLKKEHISPFPHLILPDQTPSHFAHLLNPHRLDLINCGNFRHLPTHYFLRMMTHCTCLNLNFHLLHCLSLILGLDLLFFQLFALIS
jgi:hypothetical protein